MNECREAAYYTSNFILVGLPADCWLEINATIYVYNNVYLLYMRCPATLLPQDCIIYYFEQYVHVHYIMIIYM